MTPKYTTHPKAVAGIILIASLMLFGVLFWLVIGITATIAPIEVERIGLNVTEPTFIDYLSKGRMIIAGIGALVGTAAFWLFVDSLE